MAGTLRLSFSLLLLLLCGLVFASPDVRPRKFLVTLNFATPPTRVAEFVVTGFQKRAFTNTSVQTTTLSPPIIATAPITTTPTPSTTIPSNSTTGDDGPQLTTIVLNNATIVGLPGAVMTEPPNYDLSGLDTFDFIVHSFIVAHSLYSIDWADVIGYNDDGSLVYKPHNTSGSRCPIFWEFPLPTGTPDPDDDPIPTVTEIVTVRATSPQFCATSTILPPEEVANATGTKKEPFILTATKKVTTTIFDIPTPNNAPPPPKTAVIGQTSVGGAGGAGGAENKETPINPNGLGPASVKFEGQATPVVPNTPEDTVAAQNFNNGVASAIAQLFPNSAPSNNPTPPDNPNPPNNKGPADVISDALGAVIASAFNGITPNQNGPPPQQGQISGIPYSVGPTAIVVNGNTYSPAVPTVINLPNGQSANIGPGGLTIGNNFVPTNPGGTSPPSQGVVNGVPYTLAPNGIVISGTTYSSSQPTSIPLPGGQTLVVGPGGSFQIGGTTVPLPGSSGVIGGVPYTIQPGGIVISGTTYSTSQPTSVALPNGQTLVVGPGGVVQIGGTTVPVPGSSGVIGGVPYTIQPGGIVISGTTYSTSQPTSVTLPNGQTLVVGPGGVVQIGGVVVPLPGSSGLINGVPYTIQPGGIVISGTTYSTSQPTSVTLPNGQVLVIGPGGVIQIGGTNVPLLTSGSLNGISYSITPGGSIVINGQTLNPASATAITLPGGHIVTLGPNGLSIDGTPVPMGPGKTTGPIPMNPATTTTSGQITTSHSGTVSSTGSPTSTTSTTTATATTTTTTSSTTTTSTSKAAATTTTKKGAAPGERDLIPIGTILIVGLSSILIALL